MSNSTTNIAIVVSLFNSEITEKLLEGALSKLTTSGIDKAHIQIVKVPGAVEIPLAAKLLCATGKYHAIITLGCVIQGDTDHYDYVCQQVSYGCQKVMLEFSTPVIFGVLTTQNEEQAFERVSEKSHKGIDAADAALMMISVVKTFRPERDALGFI